MVAETIGRQLLRSGTSVGANYRAAVRARSRADFVAKMGIVEEECDESIHWMEVLTELNLVTPERIASLRAEGDELLAITVSSIKTARRNQPDGRKAGQIGSLQAAPERPLAL